MNDPAEFERQAALRGFRGHGALLDPEAHVAQAVPGTLVAQNDTNELGFTDKLKIDIPREPLPDTAGALNIRTPEQAALNERLIHQGVPLDEILRREQASK